MANNKGKKWKVKKKKNCRIYYSEYLNLWWALYFYICWHTESIPTLGNRYCYPWHIVEETEGVKKWLPQKVEPSLTMACPSFHSALLLHHTTAGGGRAEKAVPASHVSVWQWGLPFSLPSLASSFINKIYLKNKKTRLSSLVFSDSDLERELHEWTKKKKA